jgi:hypothetical protein
MVLTPDLYVTCWNLVMALAVIENTWILPNNPALIDHKCDILGTRGRFT